MAGSSAGLASDLSLLPLPLQPQLGAEQPQLGQPQLASQQPQLGSLQQPQQEPQPQPQRNMLHRLFKMQQP